MYGEWGEILQAAVLLVLPILAGMACVIRPRRRPSSRQLALVIIFTLLTTSIIGGWRHMCMEGQPFAQWLIPAICLLVCMALLRVNWERRTASAVCVVAMIGLQAQFLEMVHGPVWTGNPDYAGPSSFQRRAIASALADPETTKDFGEAALPEGWLRELPLPEPVRTSRVMNWPTSRRVIPVWHSYLTGLYRYAQIEQDFWYSGGPLGEVCGRLELRDRAHPPSSH